MAGATARVSQSPQHRGSQWAQWHPGNSASPSHVSTCESRLAFRRFRVDKPSPEAAVGPGVTPRSVPPPELWFGGSHQHPAAAPGAWQVSMTPTKLVWKEVSRTFWDLAGLGGLWLDRATREFGGQLSGP